MHLFGVGVGISILQKIGVFLRMNIHVEIPIQAPREKIWEIITNFEGAADRISGIQKVEILEKPQEGIIGLKWRETRIMFGKEATEVMWITGAKENEYYQTQAESHGSIYTTRLAISGGAVDTHILYMSFTAEPQSLGAKVMAATLGGLFKNATKKALQKDLEDIKAAAEGGA